MHRTILAAVSIPRVYRGLPQAHTQDEEEARTEFSGSLRRDHMMSCAAVLTVKKNPEDWHEWYLLIRNPLDRFRSGSHPSFRNVPALIRDDQIHHILKIWRHRAAILMVIQHSCNCDHFLTNQDGLSTTNDLTMIFIISKN